LTRKIKPYEEINPLLHGTDSGYQGGCTCEPCRKAHVVRSQIYNRAKLLAAQWVKKNRTGIWEDCINESYTYYNEERGEIGRPNQISREGWQTDYNTER